MTVLMPSDTAAALKADAQHCESRSLFFDRFACPSLKQDDCRDWFRHGIETKALLIALGPSFSFVASPSIGDAVGEIRAQRGAFDGACWRVEAHAAIGFAEPDLVGTGIEIERRFFRDFGGSIGC